MFTVSLLFEGILARCLSEMKHFRKVLPKKTKTSKIIFLKQIEIQAILDHEVKN